MRRSCQALVRDLDLPVPAEPAELIDGLCSRMGQRLGQPVRHVLVKFPPGTVTGAWVATASENYIFCEQETSVWHQLAITGHEFWHMSAHHRSFAIDGGVLDPEIFPSLDHAGMKRVLATRAHSCEDAEQEAEVFASMLLVRVSRWLPDQTCAVPQHAAGLVDRLELTLGSKQYRCTHG